MSVMDQLRELLPPTAEAEALFDRVARLEAVKDAAADPFLVLLERHPDADPHANAEMRRAADRLRAALTEAESA